MIIYTSIYIHKFCGGQMTLDAIVNQKMYRW